MCKRVISIRSMSSCWTCLREAAASKKSEDSLVGKSVTVCFVADVEAAGWIVWHDGNQCGVDIAKALTEAQVGRVAKPQSTI